MIEHTVQQVAVELKAETIRSLERAGASEATELAEQEAAEEVPS